MCCWSCRTSVSTKDHKGVLQELSLKWRSGREPQFVTRFSCQQSNTVQVLNLAKYRIEDKALANRIRTPAKEKESSSLSGTAFSTNMAQSSSEPSAKKARISVPHRTAPLASEQSSVVAVSVRPKEPKATQEPTTRQKTTSVQLSVDEP